MKVADLCEGMLLKCKQDRQLFLIPGSKSVTIMKSKIQLKMSDYTNDSIFCYVGRGLVLIGGEVRRIKPHDWANIEPAEVHA